MRKITCTISAMLLLLFCTALSGSAATPPEIVTRGKSATVLVRVGGAEGSAFCIDADGLFVTNQHVIANAPNARVVMVLHAGEANQFVVPARVLRADKELDLALLKLETPQQLVALPLGSIDELFETMNVTAFGFPFGKDLSLRDNAFPNVSVSAGHVSSLRSSRGELQEIQLDAALNPGNSGGPVLDDKGRVIGVVASGITGANSVSFAIPVSQLNQFLAAPIITFEPPLLTQSQMQEEQEFIIRIAPVQQGKNPAVYNVELRIGVGSEARRFSVPPRQGDEYRVRVIPITKISGPVIPTVVPYKITVKQNGQVIGTQFGALKVHQPAPPSIPNVQVSPPAPKITAPNVATKNTDKNDWLGQAQKSAPGAEAGSTMLEAGRMLLQAPRIVVDATVRNVGIDAGFVVPDMLWSRDGKRVYVLESNGTLHMISVPEFREEKIASLNQQSSRLQMCQLGLVVALPKLQEVWLLDADTLQIIRRITISAIRDIAASPALSLVYVAQGDASRNRLSILDFGKGKVVQQVSATALSEEQGPNIKKHPSGSTLSDFGHLKVTPDGGYLFCESWRSLQRLRISGTDLVYEEASAGIGSNVHDIEISPDSQYVAMPAGGGNGSMETDTFVTDARRRATPYTTFIFRANDLSKPIVVLASGAYPSAVAFDRAGGRLYTQNYDFDLITFTLQGVEQKQYRLSGKLYGSASLGVQQILPHPSGNRLLVLANDGHGGFDSSNQGVFGKPQGALYWVELPANTENTP